MTDIIEVDEECVITYSDGLVKTCIFRPTMTFRDCDPGYGPGGHCAKYNYRSLRLAQPEPKERKQLADEDYAAKVQKNDTK